MIMAFSPNSKPSSPSPSVLGRQNPRPRNSESGDPMRRSFGGNPFPTGKPAVFGQQRGFHNPTPTPANSHSDFSRRTSTSRKSSQNESGDKENDKDHISNMAKASPTPKGTKNFMSPTISAASKINASQRKKVLADKNEGPPSSVSSDARGLVMEETKSHHVRPTVSFSDVVSFIGEDEEAAKAEMGSDQKQQVEDPYVMTITDLYQKEALDLQNSSEPSEVIVDENENDVDFDPSFMISPCPAVTYSTPVVAPLDADPLMPPYDPKKNYLSPRPQFLHYRPNPRVEHYFDECKQLEDIFTSESSDTEASKDDRHSEELEDRASQEGESIAEDEQVELEDDDDVDEEMETQVDEETESGSRISKPRRFRAFKFLGWLLVLAVAYFSVSATFCPPSELPVLRDSVLYNFYLPQDFKESAKANFEQFKEKLRIWSESSRAYIAKMVSSIGEEEEESRLKFHNLTELLEDGSFDTVFKQSKAEIRGVGSYRQAYESVERDIEEGDENVSEVEELLKQESVGENNFEAVPLEDDVEQKTDGEETSEGDSEDKDTEVETVPFHVENLEITNSRGQTKVNGGESSFDAFLKDCGIEETHDIEWNSEGEKESEIFSKDDADAEAHELQETVETEASKSEDEKRGRIESVATHEGQRTEAQVSADTEVTSLSLQGPEDLGQTVEIEGIETTKTEYDMRPEMIFADDDLEESEPQVSADVSQIFLGNLSTDQNMLVLSSTLVGVLAASAFFLTKKAKPIKPNDAAAASEPMTVAEELNFSHVPVENLIKERLSSLNFQTDGDDRMRESCPTEMSSSFEKKNTSFHSNKDHEEPSEAHSGATKSSKKNSSSSNSRIPRRESLASSTSEYSIGSTSYGSFTTYEKIPFKSGLGEDEVITPVRRSSRLRNQHYAQ